MRKFLLSISKRNEFGYLIVKCIRRIIVFFKYSIYSDKYLIEYRFKTIFERKLDWSNLKTLNEKIQWLKLYDRTDFYTICADKYAVRDFLKAEFGEDSLIPLLFASDNWREINGKNIQKYPCIIKANHTSGDFIILRDDKVNWKEIQLQCRSWLDKNYYTISQEWQYKNIKRKIVVEELLQTKDKRIPNDYKLHYINGVLQFVYVSVDREGKNKRNIYDPEWHPLYFSWVAKSANITNVRGEEITAPATFEKMKEIGRRIASYFKYVRVDFYDVDGVLYFGEITLHHGSGFDVFVPQEYDLKYGNLLKID